uniref:Protein MNN4-like n=1 Tax=Cucumis melo TaxID=3656 RepID=A0A9I9D8V1_CUCME
MKRQKELRSKVDEVALYVKKSKEIGREKTFEEFCDEGSKEIEELDPLEDDATKPRKKRKLTMEKKDLREQSRKR